MKKLLATAAMGVALTATAYAGSDTTTEADQAAAEVEQSAAEVEQTAEQAATEVEQEAEQAAAEVEQEADQAAAEAEEATDQAAAEAEQATEEAAAEVEQETEEAAAEAEQAAEATEETAADTMADGEAADGYAMVDATKMTAEELTGAAVYDTTDEWIGEISEIVLSDEGKIGTVVVDVGGFLGIGEKPVGLDYEKIKVMQAAEGGDLRVHVNSSKEELETMPEYEG